MGIELYLACGDQDEGSRRGGLSPALAGGVSLGAVSEVAKVERVGRRGHHHFLDQGADGNDLTRQRWGLVVPAGARGDELLSRVEPLILQRQADMGGRVVRVHRVPSDLSELEADKWRLEVLDRSGESDLEKPRYLLVLGDLHEVPHTVERAASGRYCVGRLAFDEPEQYEAYVDKLLRWERSPYEARRARARIASVKNDPATRLAEGLLTGPIASYLQGLQATKPGDEAYDEAMRLAGVDYAVLRSATDWSTFQALCAEKEPAVALTASHGQGAPWRRGWGSRLERMRREQGALVIGRKETITAAALGDQSFLPGGLWLLFACFGAGTPTTSKYDRWLRRLVDLKAFDASPSRVLASLPPGDHPPFISAIPKAVLASANGPLGVIGHIDLAWSYGFQDLGPDEGARHGRFQEPLAVALRGGRFGLSLATLASHAEAAELRLATIADETERARYEELPDIEQALRAGHTWMTRQDLRSYILLGDPAARLPLSPALARPEPARELSLFEIEGPRRDPSPDSADEVEQVSAAFNTPPSSTLAQGRGDAVGLERAVLRVLMGDLPAQQVAADAGIDPVLLTQAVSHFCEAGRRAVQALANSPMAPD